MMNYRIYMMTESCCDNDQDMHVVRRMDEKEASHDVMKIYRIGRKINIKHKKTAIKIYYMKFRLQLCWCV